jgi:hypothetical protein
MKDPVRNVSGKMNWQPIETAPKDGTRILLSDGVDVCSGFWVSVSYETWERVDADTQKRSVEEDGYWQATDLGWIATYEPPNDQ